MAVNTLAKIRTDINGAASQDYLRKVLGAKAPQFTTSLLSIVGGSPQLQECTTSSLMNTAMKAASLDLPLDQNLGFAYAIAYDNSKKRKNEKGEWVTDDKVMEAQFQIGYKGFIQLAIRSGQFKTINVRDVKEGEITGEDFMSGTLRFKSLPAAERINAATIGYVAYFELNNGFYKMLYMTNEELLAHAAAFSASYKNDLEGRKRYGTRHKDKSLWATNIDAMAKKTVLKLLLSKYAPMSIQMQEAIKSDQAVINSDGSQRYVDNEQRSIEDANAEEVAADANTEELPDDDEASDAEPQRETDNAKPQSAQPTTQPAAQAEMPDVFNV